MKNFSELKNHLLMSEYYNKEYGLKHYIYSTSIEMDDECFENSYSYLDIFMITRSLKIFPTVLAPSNGKPVVITCTKKIPRNVKIKFRCLPRNTFYMLFKESNQDLGIVVTQDNYNNISILDCDARFRRCPVPLPDKNKRDLIFNIRCYFEILNYFLQNDYLQYEYGDTTVYIPLDHDSIKNVFKNRDTIGRRSPIMYGVDSFTRLYKNSVITVKSHLRGICEVSQEGVNFKIIAGVDTIRKYCN